MSAQRAATDATFLSFSPALPRLRPMLVVRSGEFQSSCVPQLTLSTSVMKLRCSNCSTWTPRCRNWHEQHRRGQGGSGYTPRVVWPTGLVSCIPQHCWSFSRPSEEAVKGVMTVFKTPVCKIKCSFSISEEEVFLPPATELSIVQQVSINVDWIGAQLFILWTRYSVLLY